MENQELNPVSLETNEEPENLEMLVEEGLTEQEEIIQETIEEPENSDLPDEADPSKHEEAPQEPNTEPCARIVEKLVAVEEELKRSNQLFESKFLNDASKDEMITKLHKELQGYKDDLFKKTLKPIIMDMIVFADSMKSLPARYEETPEPEAMPEKYQKLRGEFLKVASHIEDLIYNYGVEPFSSKQGDEFNPKNQQARKSTPTDNPDEHKKIVSSLSCGFMWDEQLLRRESVHISVCEQPVENKN